MNELDGLIQTAAQAADAAATARDHALQAERDAEIYEQRSREAYLAVKRYISAQIEEKRAVFWNGITGRLSESMPDTEGAQG